MPSLTPNLWFDGNAEEAANFYASVFPDSRVVSVNHAPADSPGGPKGYVVTVDWTILGQPFTGINGGPDFTFNESISFLIDCADQAEVDRYWDALTAGGGEPGPCGWLKDRFGVSWQVVPKRLQELLNGPDAGGAQRAMEAMLQMSKLDVAKLEAAYEEGVATAVSS
jgi:predicted 3-demethylubiquinone-9 3-methyltransferase (glyoxalase superfamily)